MIDLLPVFPIELFEFRKSFRSICSALELANNDVPHVICFEELARRLNIDSIIEITNLGNTTLNPGRFKKTLLTLVPVPTHDTRQARVYSKACTPAIFGAIRFYNDR